MEINLISDRFYQIKSELIHGGYSGDMLENHILDVLSTEILSDFVQMENYEEIKKSLINMFFFGQVMMFRNTFDVEHG